MRVFLFCGLVLVLFGVGVVQAHRAQDAGGIVSGWIQSPEPNAEPPGTEPTAGPASQAPEEAPPESVPTELASEAAQVFAAGDLSVVDDSPEAPAPMLRYTDVDGSTHMVRSLARVPEPYRADAVVVGRGNVSRVSIPTPTAVAFQDWQPDPNPNRSKVVLYSAPWCGACKRAKRHLIRQRVPYVERDIESDRSAARDLKRLLGRIAIPLLDVNGRYVSGYRRDVYDRVLGSG